MFAVGTVLVFVSLITQGVIRYEIFNLSVTSWDFVGLVLLPIIIKALIDNRRIVDLIPTRTKILVASYVVALGISILRSPDIGNAYTIGLMVIRNIVLALWVYYAVQICGAKQISKLIVFTVAIASSLAIVLFVSVILFDPGVLDDRRPYGYIILLIDEYKTPRLTGFAGDPNFFAISVLMTIGLSFYILASSKDLLRKLTLVALFVSIVGLILTLSRTGLATLFIVLVLSSLVLILKSNQLRSCWRDAHSLLGSSVFAVILLVVLFFPVIPDGAKRTSVFNVATARFEKLSDSPRFEQWEKLIAFTGSVKNEAGDSVQIDSVSQLDNVIFGRGLRTNQIALGAYSHNSLLDVLFETGLLSLTILLLLWWVPITKLHRSSLHFTLKLGIYVNALGLAMMMMTLSAAYQPYWWIIWAITMSYAWMGADEFTPDRELNSKGTQRLSFQ
ncbi:O-antigen ligase family protein [Candidatus Lucifugimonas marina]|uniref:O-antigen ligase family protein n=1 Tax=Candidatus Lucifugimonas marina TaxID=3038979 RepID=A0AAJ5ZCQ1_9CHLR|nr:hypothetical protein [SAR202 cluster bacterium JH702]MDG0868253.1 hypothetical protein [SAR202 cluster bacterium JH639]WFG34897.1 hypothetical protein GKN94_04080 [SAR202 cluster bacterium JH545]WFG38848.1 hypothetical protein GKO48_04215 [SAR202 cluster bacterium JH1073]